ncbi:MAG: S-adenosylmethionine:tRNA ribosyltransferase-isomerase, partial [Bacteroidaceae bacterium]|nr:S-adenosylmethionine:tRNA ribosyltransferase-isomerase [Bacteroidaceae bacterium]
EHIEGHTMHAEWIAVERKTLERLLSHGASCIAVGTTSVRTLESLYYIGVMIHKNPNVALEDLHVPQWMPYEYAAEAGEKLSAAKSLQAILNYMDRNGMQVLHTATQIIIAPGYKYNIVRAIVTNFHQPQSTLLLLVSALIGDNWKRVYDYALQHDFRFLSYGDSSLLIP